MPYVYFVQPAVLVDTDRYKIGMSSLNNQTRLDCYSRGTRVLCVLECTNANQVENALKHAFNEQFNLFVGREYYRINDEQAAIDLFVAIHSEYAKTIGNKPDTKLASKLNPSLNGLYHMYEHTYVDDRSFTSEQILTMVGSQIYKFINLLTEQQLRQYYSVIVSAFQNQSELTNEQRYFMLRSLCSKYLDESTLKCNELCAGRHQNDQWVQPMVQSSATKLTKLVKALYPEDCKEIKRSRLMESRRIKYSENRRTKMIFDDTHQVVAFLQQIQETDYGMVKAGVLYDQYVQFCDEGNSLTCRGFGRLLNTHGIITKKLHKGGYYSITEESINTLLGSFNG